MHARRGRLWCNMQRSRPTTLASNRFLRRCRAIDGTGRPGRIFRRPGRLSFTNIIDDNCICADSWVRPIQYIASRSLPRSSRHGTCHPARVIRMGGGSWWWIRAMTLRRRWWRRRPSIRIALVSTIGRIVMRRWDASHRTVSRIRVIRTARRIRTAMGRVVRGMIAVRGRRNATVQTAV